jgi:hypothetical protein
MIAFEIWRGLAGMAQSYNGFVRQRHETNTMYHSQPNPRLTTRDYDHDPESTTCQIVCSYFKDMDWTMKLPAEKPKIADITRTNNVYPTIT